MLGQAGRCRCVVGTGEVTSLGLALPTIRSDITLKPRRRALSGVGIARGECEVNLLILLMDVLASVHLCQDLYARLLLSHFLPLSH